MVCSSGALLSILKLFVSLHDCQLHSFLYFPCVSPAPRTQQHMRGARDEQKESICACCRWGKGVNGPCTPPCA